MFEGYSDSARHVVTLAEAEARQLGHRHIGTEHLLLGLLSERHSAVRRALPGTTLHAVRRKVDEAVGNTSSADGEDLPFTPRAKRALERASRFSVQRHDAQVDPNHVLLGVLDVEGTAGQVLRGLGVDIGRLRDAADRNAGQKARRPREIDDPPEEPSSPRCAECGASLDTALSYRLLPATGDDGTRRTFVVAHCASCGTALGVAPE